MPIVREKIPSISKGLWLQELLLEGIQLTDVDTRDELIVLLIGADIAGKLSTGKQKELKCGAIALETLLRWTLIGKVDNLPQQKEDAILIVVSMFTC